MSRRCLSGCVLAWRMVSSACRSIVRSWWMVPVYEMYPWDVSRLGRVVGWSVMVVWLIGYGFDYGFVVVGETQRKVIEFSPSAFEFSSSSFWVDCCMEYGYLYVCALCFVCSGSLNGFGCMLFGWLFTDVISGGFQ